MLILTIVTVFITFGLAFTGPIQNDNVKSASVSAGVKGQDLSIKYGYDDQSGESKIAPQASPVQPQGVWQSRPIGVQSGQVDPVQDNSYVPIIDAKPQVKWYHHDVKKQQLSPGDLVIEQRKEEPVVVSNYESSGGVSVNGEIYDPYRDILPEVLTGKRRLGDDDAPAVGQSESGSVSSSSAGGVRGVPVTVNSGEVSSSKFPVRSVIYGDKNVPQHVYTEDTFPSVITVKGRQYVIIPKQSDKVSPFYGAPQHPWQWGFSGAQHGVYYGPGSESYVYHSGPTKVAVSAPGLGHGYGVYGNRQLIHTHGHGHGSVSTGHPGQVGHVGDIYKTYAGWAGQNVHRQHPVPSIHGVGSTVSTSHTGYERPSVHPDYAPYVHTQFVHKIPYRHAYYQHSVYHPQQSPYYGFHTNVPGSQVPKFPIGVSHGTKQNWAWVLAPQYGSSEVVEGGNWAVKGAQPGKGVAEAPVVASGGPVQVDGQQDTKQVFKGVTVEADKTKVVQSSPDVKQVPGKNWLIYAPPSSQWSYGWSQPSWYERPWYPPVIPQYSGQWAAADGEKAGQWSSASIDQPWPVKAQSSSESGITVDGHVVQSPLVKQPVQVNTVSGEKAQSVESVPSAPVSSPQVQQSSVVGGSGGVSYALHIDHSSGGKYSFEQSPKSSEENKKS